MNQYKVLGYNESVTQDWQFQKNKRCVIFKISRISDDFKQTYFNIMIMNKDEFHDVSLIQDRSKNIKANLKTNEIITSGK